MSYKAPDVWFIADTHFNHASILKFEPEKRPFATLQEHDETLIHNWNTTIQPDDTIWHLGDFCFGGKDTVQRIGERLHGKKHLVMGNHDCYGVELYHRVFTKIFGAVVYKEFILTHIPINHIHRNDMVNIHGHLHSKQVGTYSISGTLRKPSPIHICVSVEQTGLKPIHIDEIRRIVRERNGAF